MGNGTIAFMFAAGCAAWVYAKTIRRSGGNHQTAILASAVCGVILLIIMWVTLNRFF